MFRKLLYIIPVLFNSNLMWKSDKKMEKLTKIWKVAFDVMLVIFEKNNLKISAVIYHLSFSK